MKIAGKEGKCTKTDDYTLKFTFPVPYGLFMNLLATPDWQLLTNIQAEFAKKYMKKFVEPAKLEADMKAGGFTNYLDYFQAMVYRQVGSGTLTEYVVSGRPTMFPYVVDKAFTGSATQVTFARNPYFFKVDEKGQQYPYIDKITVRRVRRCGRHAAQGHPTAKSTTRCATSTPTPTSRCCSTTRRRAITPSST